MGQRAKAQNALNLANAAKAAGDEAGYNSYMNAYNYHAHKGPSTWSRIKPFVGPALSLASMFIPGLGPLGMAAMGAAGGGISGGAKGALLGGLGGAVGGGMFGGAAATTGIGPIDAINSGITNSLSPIGRSITSGLSDIASPLTSLFSNSTPSADASAMADAGVAPGFSTLANANAADGAGGFAGYGSSGFGSGAGATSGMTPAQQTLFNIGGASGGSAASGGSSPLSTIAKLAQIAQAAMGGARYPGTQSQTDIQNQQDQLRQNQQKLNQQYESALNAGSQHPMDRSQTNPSTDYYTYGTRPEASFFNNTNPNWVFPNVQTSPLQSLKRGGIPKSNPNANGAGGQDDNVQANLSPGEYVIPADVVSSLGDGSSEGGGNALDAMVHHVRKHKSGKGGGLPPMAKSPLQYMGAGA